MFHPRTNRDASANLELQLARQLREVNPAFDKTKVDFTPFKALRAKIDCLTVSGRPPFVKADLEGMQRSFVGTLSGRNDTPAVTIHDPALSDLQYLLDYYPKARIDYIEIAVDAFLPDGSNELYLLRQLKEQMRHCMAPHEHPDFTPQDRAYWDLAGKKRLADSVLREAPLTTVTYASRWKGLSMKLYLKTKDQRKSVPIISLRTELSMEVPDWSGLDFVADLPTLAVALRKYCSKVFFIGRGFKKSDSDGSKWNKFGAAPRQKKTTGLSIRPDTVANRKFGDALSILGRSLRRLKP